MTVAEFIAKWSTVELKERSAAQEHFLDLCRVLGHPTPAESDPSGESFCFEKGASKQGGGEGVADVWKKGFFGWEYKGKHTDLRAAYDQLLLYRDALASPPLLVACDMDRIVVHTNFTNTVSMQHEVRLAEMAQPRSLEILRALFHEPEKLKPGRTSAAVTTDAAERFAAIAEAMRHRGVDAGQAAHFLNRLVFCLFAEDIGLLPDMIFTRLIEKSGAKPEPFGRLVGHLFSAMAQGGEFGLETIRRFNGNLFNDAVALPLTEEELKQVIAASALDWGAVDPSIMGTLFERGLDPQKQSQLGAHYTCREDIEAVIAPVVMEPLRDEWREVQTVVNALLTTGKKPLRPGSGAVAAGITSGASAATDAGVAAPPLLPAGKLRKARGEADTILARFLSRLQEVKVLDPACGSGNFLYVTLQQLKDLEKEVIVFAMNRGLSGYLPMVGPWQFYGIEKNAYAHDLAQTSVWIGFLQWTRANGFQIIQDPVLRPMAGNFLCQDAVLDCSDPAVPKEPEWPAADFIVGNPPFLGGKLLRRELGDAYVDGLFRVWEGRVPHEADLCCYWFEKARAQLQHSRCRRAGLLATQGIRGGANREVLTRIRATGNIFFAESDRPWVLDGASVHVSMVGFDRGDETRRVLDGRPVSAINANLSSALDVTQARQLPENADLAFMGDTKGGAFDVDADLARHWLADANPHGRPNADVLVPWTNGLDVTGRARGKWIIDFGTDMTEAAAALYEQPFQYVATHVKPVRASNSRDAYRRYWWRHVEARSGLRAALAGLPRFLATIRVAKHRLFVWMSSPTLPDSAIFVFPRSDDYFFGVLQSRVHEVWALKQGTRLETRPRYTPTSCFETFPFPWPPGKEPADQPLVCAIAEAARELCELRNRWLNPPEWTRVEYLEFPATPGGLWQRYMTEGAGGISVAEPPATPWGKVQRAALYGELKAEFEPPASGTRDDSAPALASDIGLARFPTVLPTNAASAASLSKRTLTTLYNQRPAWLANAHRRLDDAVCAAYGWNADLNEDQILEHLLALNLSRAG